jgi:hypothetical protein
MVFSSICSTLVHLFLEKHKMSAMIRLVLTSMKKDAPGRRAPSCIDHFYIREGVSCQGIAGLEIPLGMA